MGHTLSDNRHGLIASAVVTIADGYAEREAAKVMTTDAKQVADEKAQITLGADKGYNAAEFVEALTKVKVLPHVAQSISNRKSAVPDHIAASDGFVISQQKRKLISRIWFGQTCWSDSSGDGARFEEGRPAICADDGDLQPHRRKSRKFSFMLST